MPAGDTDGAAVQAHGSSQSPLGHKSHALRVDSTTHRPSIVDAPPKVGGTKKERTEHE